MNSYERRRMCFSFALLNCAAAYGKFQEMFMLSGSGMNFISILLAAIVFLSIRVANKIMYKQDT